MKNDYIAVETSNVPYEFDIILADENFLIGIDYNETGEFFTAKLSKMNEETGVFDEVCAGEPIIYGMPLWGDVYKSGKYPAVVVVPKDESGLSNAVTFDNLNTVVFLTIDNGN